MAHHHFHSAPNFRPYRWAKPEFQAGLQPIAADDWLLIDDTYADFMRQKRAHLERPQARLYRTLPSSLPAQRELRDLAVDHLVSAHAERFMLDHGRLTGADGISWDLRDDSCEPLFQLTRFVQEDFMLLEQLDGKQAITAASNAYSSSGRLTAAVGRDVRWCHEPIPDLTATHGPRIDRILSSVHENSLTARFNWQLTPLSTLFFPPDPHAANQEALATVSDVLAKDPSRAPQLLYMRVERQTLRRLPRTRAVAFSIHTYSDPLSSLIEDSEAIGALLELLKGYSESRLRYTEMHTLRRAVITWLETQVAAGA